MDVTWPIQLLAHFWALEQAFPVGVKCPAGITLIRRLRAARNGRVCVIDTDYWASIQASSLDGARAEVRIAQKLAAA